MCKFPWDHKYGEWVVVKVSSSINGDLKMIQQKTCTVCKKAKLRGTQAG